MAKDLKRIDELIDQLLGLVDTYAIPDDMDINQACNLLVRAQKVVAENEANKVTERKLDLDEKKFNSTIEEAKFANALKQRELDIKEKELEEKRKSEKRIFIIQLVTVGATSVVSLIGTLVGLAVYTHQSNKALQLTLIDNGLPSSAYKDSSKVVNDYIARNCTSIKK